MKDKKGHIRSLPKYRQQVQQDKKKVIDLRACKAFEASKLIQEMNEGVMPGQLPFPKDK